MTGKIQANTQIEQDLDKALSLHKQGQLEQAEVLYRSVLEREPDHADALHMMGVLACQAGNFTAGLKLIGRALEENAANPFYHNNYGYTLMAVGQLDRALDHLNKALALKPDYVDALNNLGRVYQVRGNLSRALMCYRRALDLNPRFASAFNNMGTVLHARGQLQEAVDNYHQAVTVDPSFSAAYNNLGAALLKLGRTDQAKAILEGALEQTPDNPDLLANLAELCEKTQQPEQAASYIEKALAQAPLHPAANRLASVRLRRQGKLREALDGLVAVPIPEFDPLVARELHFELGTLYDRLAESDLSFTHYTEGKHLQAQSARYSGTDQNRYWSEVRTITEAVTREWVETWIDLPADLVGPAPVFLLGFPCSGSVLLNEILACHPRLRVMEGNPALDLIRREVGRLPEGYPAALSMLSGADAARLRSVYWRAVRERAGFESGPGLVDSFPLNMVQAGLITRLFPEAKVINLVRHPLDVCLSCYFHPFEIDNIGSGFLSLDNTASLLVAAMAAWQRSAELLSLTICTVKYEELLAAPGPETRKLVEWLGLEWDAALLPGVERTAAGAPRSRWKRYSRYLEAVRDRLEPLARNLGYAMSIMRS